FTSTTGSTSFNKEVNSSSANSARKDSTSGSSAFIAATSNSTATSVSIVTSCLLYRILSRLFCSDSRYVFFSTSAACSSACSTLPKRRISSTDPLSPIPGAPGMLSTASPRNAITSTTFDGGTPRISSTFAASQIRLSFGGFKTCTLSLTNCSMSLSLETT